MARGDKSAYSNKQKRQAEKIEKGYEARGTPAKEAKRRAWATVNKMWGGGQKSSNDAKKPSNSEPAKKGGKLGGRQRASKRSTVKRSTTAKKSGKRP